VVRGGETKVSPHRKHLNAVGGGFNLPPSLSQSPSQSPSQSQFRHGSNQDYNPVCPAYPGADFQGMREGAGYREIMILRDLRGLRAYCCPQITQKTTSFLI
jgi:hypothetical protein